MKSVTTKTPTPDWVKLPVAWLARFSSKIPSYMVRKLMVCRTLRKTLTTNTSWLEQCENLEDFRGLSHDEKHVMIQPEGFWYGWYNMHCPRYIPIRPPREVKFHTRDWSMSLDVPEVGSLFMNRYQDPNTPIRSKVCVEIAVHTKGKNATIPHIFKLYDCWDTVNNMLKKKRAVTKLYGVTEVKIRETGNLSVDIALLDKREYPK
jgi:hypothetical protein